MSSEENKTMVRRVFEEGINGGDESVIDELVSSQYVNHDMPAPAPGADGFKQVVGQFRQAFPDITITIDEQCAEGDIVANRGHFNGTHGGDFMGVPATGSTVEVKYMDFWRVRDGKLAENWVQIDVTGLMQQIGALPAPAT